MVRVDPVGVPLMDIFLRPPSATWEPVPLPDVPGAAVWAWFRPPAAPCGIIFQIPLESHAAKPDAFTVRRLLNALKIDCKLTRMCFDSQEPFDTMQGMNPLLDRPVQPPAPGVVPTVAVHLAPPTQYSPSAYPPVASPQGSAAAAQPRHPSPRHATGSPELHFHAIESDWHAIQLLESKNLLLRAQMNSMLTRMVSLNRDLSPEERNASDTMDHRDWNEARRWIRDGVSVLSRVVRTHDIGVTSAAGHRNHLEEVVAKYITARVLLPNLAEIQHQFEVHRKTVQSLHQEMQHAMLGPARDGEQRAQAVLTRIRAKVQADRRKR